MSGALAAKDMEIATLKEEIAELTQDLEGAEKEIDEMRAMDLAGMASWDSCCESEWQQIQEFAQESARLKKENENYKEEIAELKKEPVDQLLGHFANPDVLLAKIAQLKKENKKLKTLLADCNIIVM